MHLIDIDVYFFALIWNLYIYGWQEVGLMDTYSIQSTTNYHTPE